MKKLLLGALLSMAFLTSCNGGLEKSKNGGLEKSKNGKIYYLTVKGTNGDKTESTVKFSMSSEVVDSLKISEEKIKLISETAVRYADYNAKYKLTYKLPDSAMLYYDAEENTLRVSIDGSAENAYGTPDNINTFIDFTLNGEIKKIPSPYSGLDSLLAIYSLP